MMLNAFQADGRFWRGNLHGHSNRSDGAAAPEEVCRIYAGAGYDFVAITDHFLDRYGFPLTDTAPYRQAGFTTLIGAEVHAPGTSRGELWHILAVGLPPDFAPTGPDEDGPALARRCARAGAFVTIVHPHWSQLTLADADSIEVAHAVELYNHTSAVNCDRGDGLVLYDQILGAGRRLGAIATDDSHFRIPDAFGGWVMVKAAENAPGALLEALMAGRYYASQGPRFDDITRDGDELVVACSPVRSVMLIGPKSGSTAHHGDQLTQARLPLDAYAGAWCRAVLIDEQGKRAWSNPLWLD